MKHLFKVVAIAILLCASPVISSAQKVGHLNVDSLLKIWPAYERISDSLTKVKAAAENQAAKMYMEMEKKAAERDSLSKTPMPSPTIMRLLEVQLAQMQENYQGYLELESYNLQLMEAKLVDSLYTILSKAITAVAKEKGYAYIMDSSKGGGVWYADPAYDCFDAVRIKLGIPVPKPKTPAPGGAPAPGGQPK